MTSVDELVEDRVHHVVVQGPAATGFVRLTSPSGELDLEERPLFDVRLGDVDDQVVGKHQLGERVAAALSDNPVLLPVEAVPERQVGVQPGTEGTGVGVPWV